MDLTLLIVLIIAGFLLYYLIETIRSLQKEIKEMKIKCIKSVYDDNSTALKDNTLDISITLQENLLNILNNAKNMFDKYT